MAVVVVTLKIMPESPEIDLKSVSGNVSDLVQKFGGNVGRTEQEPIAFGLKALNIMFTMSEDIGGTEDLESQIEGVEGVQSVQVTDVRRTLG